MLGRQKLCGLPECVNVLPKGRRRYCSDAHAQRHRQRLHRLQKADRHIIAALVAESHDDLVASVVDGISYREALEQIAARRQNGQVDVPGFLMFGYEQDVPARCISAGEMPVDRLVADVFVDSMRRGVHSRRRSPILPHDPHDEQVGEAADFYEGRLTLVDDEADVL